MSMHHLHDIIKIVLVSIFLYACNKKHYTPSRESLSQNHKITDSLAVDSSIYNKMEKYRLNLELEMNEVLNISDTPMVKGRPESLLSNFFADVCFNNVYRLDTLTLKPDFALFNNGGLRTSLPKGEITKGKIFELMPFENELVLISISGSNMNKLLKYIVEKGGEPISNMQLSIANMRVQSCFIHHQPFDSLKNYTVLTSDYLANGGDNMDFFVNPIKYIGLNIKIRDILIKDIVQKKQSGLHISSALDGRIAFKP